MPSVSDSLIVPPPQYRDFVLNDWLAWRQAGLRCALLTLVATHGGSPRPLGSQMAVCEDSRSVGLISGGCIERALVLDAAAAIARGDNHTERYGEGSRFADLRLPCGSGIDIHFDVIMPEDSVAATVEALRRRERSSLDCGGFVRAYRPALRVVLVGQGPIMASAATFAAQLEMEVVIFTPDDDTTVLNTNDQVTVYPLPTADAFDAGVLDSDAALVTLFHDHALEPEVLKRALDTPAFYIGALGSRKAHAQRLDHLRDLGVPEDACARIRGPVGLDIGALTPPEIALSAMAEVVACYRQSR